MNKRPRRQTPEPRVSAEQPPFPRRAGVLRMALGLAALAPASVLAAFPANLDLGSLDGSGRRARVRANSFAEVSAVE